MMVTLASCMVAVIIVYFCFGDFKVYIYYGRGKLTKCKVMIMTKHVIALYVNEVENLLHAKRLSFTEISKFEFCSDRLTDWCASTMALDVCLWV